MMNLTPHASAGHWTSRYVGRLWATDFTCWHLVAAVQAEVFDRALPAFDVVDVRDGDDIRALIERSAWRRVGHQVEGDIVAMHGPDGPHVGVLVLHGVRPKLLHNLGGMGEAGPHGSVRLDALADLGRLGYGRFELWGPPA
jgi:hypothetical protein